MKVGDLVICKRTRRRVDPTDGRPILVANVSDRGNDYSSLWFLSENPMHGWLAAVDYEVVSEGG